VPLKSFDCLASSLHVHGTVVVQAVADGGGVVVERVIGPVEAPAPRLRFRNPTVVAPLGAMFPLPSRR
jgi:hypothetical protein